MKRKDFDSIKDYLLGDLQKAIDRGADKVTAGITSHVKDYIIGMLAEYEDKFGIED